MTDRTPTERLREILDEMQIEHFDYDKGGRTQTQWEAPDGRRHFTYETKGDEAKTARLVVAWFPTPEQAIAATVGAGTCADAPRLRKRITAYELAELMGVSMPTVYRMLERGEIANAVKFGAQWRIDPTPYL